MLSKLQTIQSLSSFLLGYKPSRHLDAIFINSNSGFSLPNATSKAKNGPSGSLNKNQSP
jgi:hypothetical protein